MFAAPAALSFCSHSGFNVGVSCSMAAGTTHRPPTGRGWEAGPGVDLPKGMGVQMNPKIAGAEKLHLSAPGWIAPARWRRRT